MARVAESIGICWNVNCYGSYLLICNIPVRSVGDNFSCSKLLTEKQVCLLLFCQKSNANNFFWSKNKRPGRLNREFVCNRLTSLSFENELLSSKVFLF